MVEYSGNFFSIVTKNPRQLFKAFLCKLQNYYKNLEENKWKLRKSSNARQILFA